MSDNKVTIREKNSGRVLATGLRDKDVHLFEGAWYFSPDKVDMTHLVVTERTYVCPYKGICYWIDLDAPEKKARGVGWTYFKVKRGYEYIKDAIAFHAGVRAVTTDG